MNPGLLRHKVSVQRLTEARASDGGIVRSWATLATLWAQIEPVTGREAWIADAQRAVATHSVTMRWNAVRPKDRLLYGNRVFNIVAVANANERNHVMTLAVQEVQ